MTAVEGVRDGQTHDGVAKKLQALVMASGQVPMLVQVAAVDQRLLQQVQIPNREPQPLGKSGCGAHPAG